MSTTGFKEIPSTFTGILLETHCPFSTFIDVFRIPVHKNCTSKPVMTWLFVFYFVLSDCVRNWLSLRRSRGRWFAASWSCRKTLTSKPTLSTLMRSFACSLGSPSSFAMSDKSAAKLHVYTLLIHTGMYHMSENKYSYITYQFSLLCD